LKSCDRILEAQKIIILDKIEGDRIFRVIENIEEIRYIPNMKALGLVVSDKIFENLFFDPMTYLCNQSEPFEHFS